MAERLEEELFEDFYSEEAEGAAEMLEEGEEFEEFDLAGEEGEYAEEEFEAEDEFEEGFEEEGFEEFDLAGEEYAESDMDAFDEAMAYALGAEDADEFVRRLRRGIRRAGRVVGRVARAAAPIASMIPLPQAQIAAQGLRLLGQLRAEGASEMDCADAFAEMAVQNRAVLPLAAGTAARALLGRVGATLTPQARRAAVRALRTAATSLAQTAGPRAVRALPRIVRSVRRTAVTRRTPPRTLPALVRRTAARVAANPRMVRRLAQPLPAAARVRRIGRPGRVLRTLVFRRPIRITITRAR